VFDYLLIYLFFVLSDFGCVVGKDNKWGCNLNIQVLNNIW
jgi:hypothetical protein